MTNRLNLLSGINVDMKNLQYYSIHFFYIYYSFIVEFIAYWLNDQCCCTIFVLKMAKIVKMWWNSRHFTSFRKVNRYLTYSYFVMLLHRKLGTQSWKFREIKFLIIVVWILFFLWLFAWDTICAHPRK